MVNFNSRRSTQAPMLYCPPGYIMVPVHHLIPPPAIPRTRPTVPLRFVEEKQRYQNSRFPDFSVPPPMVPGRGASGGPCPPHSTTRSDPKIHREGGCNIENGNDKRAPVLQNASNIPMSAGQEKDRKPRCTFGKGVVRTYAKGINGSDYEKTDKIPVFEPFQLEKERKICETIFEILRKNLGMSLEQLFNEIEKHELGFSGEEELQKCIENRPHLFEKTWEWETIRNRGFGYRRGMVYLSCLILNYESSHPEGAKLTEIYDEAAAFPTYHLEDAWTDDYLWAKQLGKEDFLQFLRKNLAIYELTINDAENAFETAYVKIRPSAKLVPSLWDSTLLTTVQEYRQRLEGQCFFDKSRIFHAMGHVNYSCDKYARVIISEGPFLGRSVHIDPSVANLRGRSMVEVLPINSKAAVSFYFALFHGEHFHCMAIKPENQLEDDDAGYTFSDEEDSVEGGTVADEFSTLRL